ncbi:hypothetical protein [Bradyrhizobium roseum]|uniref:hypothetical protein n=1 Tax=Bradyrhizobium roseum TaxID=3056648 RepID=UPI002618F6FD|nr:hypothetical protein [Bradyrhizobium roseus]WKA28122.1 hypothetical protein QUH67_32035 [Bradyrhizobium roseus]
MNDPASGMFRDICHAMRGAAHLVKNRKQSASSVLMSRSRRVTTGHNGDDGRGNFAGFLSRHQRIGTR